MAITERKQRERKARVNLILKAGLKTFSHFGYHNASMDLIAEQAELGKSTLYYYYKSKDELLLAILENGLKDFFCHLEETLSQSEPPLKKLEQVIKISLSFFSSHPDYLKLYLYLNAHPAFQEQILKKLNPVLSSKRTLFYHLFEDAQKEGLIINYPVEQLISIFGSLVMGTGIFMRGGKPEKFEEMAELIDKVLLNGIKK